jgi:hypothetical protein
VDQYVTDPMPGFRAIAMKFLLFNPFILFFAITAPKAAAKQRKRNTALTLSLFMLRRCRLAICTRRR